MFDELSGARILVTGHTGFKGSWLASWLLRKGAVVGGFALAPVSKNDLFVQLRLADRMQSIEGDIRDYEAFAHAISDFKPTIVFHLAAQALVRKSYRDPIETFSTNVMGTAHVLEAARHTSSVKAIVCVTTDKVYEDKAWPWGYREIDRLGGKDPYSASKACAELIAHVYQSNLLEGTGIALATARGGNVVGGGDWSEDRLIPDVVRALMAKQPIVLRNPGSVRPWQHVLELCRAYLVLAECLMRSPNMASGAWNFGPHNGSEAEVIELVKGFLTSWGAPDWLLELKQSSLLETSVLKLDTQRAFHALGYRSQLSFSDTVRLTAEWYRAYCLGGSSAALLVDSQLDEYHELLR